MDAGSTPASSTDVFQKIRRFRSEPPYSQIPQHLRSTHLWHVDRKDTVNGQSRSLSPSFHHNVAADDQSVHAEENTTLQQLRWMTDNVLHFPSIIRINHPFKSCHHASSLPGAQTSPRQLRRCKKNTLLDHPFVCLDLGMRIFWFCTIQFSENCGTDHWYGAFRQSAHHTQDPR